ncbi:hypothetical protein GEV33_013259 [Tenebrio molitor]|uniref:Uncharacterized protein n=1 Tax=Tenebrio molitor TaxID=7067 RepID=A0A8J6H794_TENMO|nr:hypothetical protein GEV33_013259 [Tenebrio molitor]
MKRDTNSCRRSRTGSSGNRCGSGLHRVELERSTCVRRRELPVNPAENGMKLDSSIYKLRHALISKAGETSEARRAGAIPVFLFKYLSRVLAGARNSLFPDELKRDCHTIRAFARGCRLPARRKKQVFVAQIYFYTLKTRFERDSGCRQSPGEKLSPVLDSEHGSRPSEC